MDAHQGAVHREDGVDVKVVGQCDGRFHRMCIGDDLGGVVPAGVSDLSLGDGSGRGRKIFDLGTGG